MRPSWALREVTASPARGSQELATRLSSGKHHTPTCPSKHNMQRMATGADRTSPPPALGRRDAVSQVMLLRHQVPRTGTRGPGNAACSVLCFQPLPKAGEHPSRMKWTQLEEPFPNKYIEMTESFTLKGKREIKSVVFTQLIAIFFNDYTAGHDGMLTQTKYLFTNLEITSYIPPHTHFKHTHTHN